MPRRSVVFAGGGTGGHVFPMIAVADAVRRIDPEARLAFVGTARGFESRWVPASGYELKLLGAAPLRGGGLGTALRGSGRALTAVWRARALVTELAPDVVLAAGGYAAGPFALAARLRGVPAALLEPNTVPGLANRLIAPWAARAYTAFEESERHFAARAVKRTGVPVRSGFVPTAYARRPSVLRVLVLGGSQGALTLNEIVPQALTLARTPIEVVHQAGSDRAHEVMERYHRLGESARVVEFIEDMPAALAAADLVIGRAGASAIAEICAVGRPAILIPYPHASGDHQRRNAEAVARQGAALVFGPRDLSSENLAEQLDTLASLPGRLEGMAEEARRAGRPGAAALVAEDLLELCRTAARRSSIGFRTLEVL